MKGVSAGEEREKEKSTKGLLILMLARLQWENVEEKQDGHRYTCEKD